jgi:hypothetical protein
MTPTEYLEALEPTRKELLSELRALLLKHESKITEEVSHMMGKQMLVYKSNGHFKYALASTKEYASFHSMPIYGSPTLREKYIALLPKVKFQKGCINIKKESDIPLNVAESLMVDSAKVQWPPKAYVAYLERKKRK